MSLRRVVVTGLGSLTPIGSNTSDFWKSMLQGVSGAGPVTHFDASLFKCRIACELKGFDPLNFFDRKEARKIDPFSQYAIVAADEAIADADLTGHVDPLRVGVIWGVGLGGCQSFQDECFDFEKGQHVPRFSPFFVPRVISNICAGYISIRHHFMGVNYVVSAACASSGIAIGNAFDAIRLGRADVVVTGGSEAAITVTGIGGFSSMQALSTRNDDPLTASRPFDKGRDGFVMGEGAAALILEERDHALARGAKIYAEITGCGFTSDAHHITAPHPDGDGAIEAMRLAVEDSGMQLSDVDHINTHGTSTPLGDLVEPKAVLALFGEHAYKISLNSTKSMTGHLLGAAGAVEAVATVLTVQNDIVPPTINHFGDDMEIPALDFTFHQPKNRKVDFALSNAFGFGGHNVCLAFRKHSE